MSHVVISERSVPCRSAVASLWPILGDSGYMNRVAALTGPRLHEWRDGVGAARYVVRTRAFGVVHVWEELPFEGVHHERFRLRQRMDRGFIHSAVTHFRFEAGAEPGATTVHLRLEQEVKSPLLHWFATRIGASVVDRLAQVVREVDAALQAGRVLPQPAVQVDAAALARAQAALGAGDLARRLCAYVAEAREEDVARLQPFVLADAWGLPRREVLTACLDAVTAGLLDLRWDVLCPSCRVGAEETSTLAAVAAHGQCPLCDLRFSVAAEDAVEVTFRVSPTVRTLASTGANCQAGPARMPHIRSQAVVPARGHADLPVPRHAGSYRLFVRGESFVPLDLAAEAPLQVTVADTAPGPHRVAPGGTLRVTSTVDRDRHAKLEEATFVPRAATLRDVATLPRFRRAFSAELLHVGHSLHVARTALLFSDLTGSTQLYSAVGDAAALRLVQDHFTVVVGIIETHRGTLVKTIGDAVMAAFADELDAVAAAVAILAAFPAFRRSQEHGAAVDIKLGAYAGPSYLLTANGILDYFGQTVNVAARLQAQARGGELVVDEGLAQRAQAAGVLAAGLVREAFRPHLKGVDAALGAVRIAVAAGEGEPGATSGTPSP